MSEGVAASEPQSLDALFAWRVAQTPHAVACHSWDTHAEAWHPTTWQQLDDRAQWHAQALVAAGLRPGERVALWLPNSPEWLVLEQAAYRAGGVVVGLYAEESAPAVHKLLQHAEPAHLLVDQASQWSALAALGPVDGLRRVVVMNGETPPADPNGPALLTSLQHLSFDDVALPPPSQPSDIASLVFTSGSAGAPRAAVLTHAALACNARACFVALQPQPGDLRLSLLPLSHSFERVAGWYCDVLSGGEVAFGRGTAHLMEDLASIRPHSLLAVPRVYEHLYRELQRRMAGAPMGQRTVFKWLAQSPRQSRRNRLGQRLGGRLQRQFLDSLGGRLRMAVSGGAALSPQITQCFRGLGVALLQGYGLTEAGPVVSVHRGMACDVESCGQALPGVELRITPQGELLVRSPSQMLGYWRDAEATAAAIDPDGWLHTGDKASRLCQDHLYLTGRLKELLVTSTGMKVCAAYLEAQLTADPAIAQALVVGEARPYVSALLVPHTQGLPPDLQSLPPDSPALAEALLSRCREHLQSLPRSHQLHAVAVVPPFTLANGQLTASGKQRRNSILRQHAERIEALYDGHSPCPQKTDGAANSDVR